MKIYLKKNPDSKHKWVAIFENGRTVKFGARGYSDYTIHKTKERMHRYLVRHRKTETWGPSGKYTAGFWSRWLLWSEPNFKNAIRRTEKALSGNYKIFVK